MTLPSQYKRIQLEIECELPFIDESETLDEYYVEIFERNQADASEWINMATLKQKEELKSSDRNVFQKSSEKYAVVAYAINLTKWTGREIRLDLVSRLQSKKSEGNKGRWMNLKLVGSRFDYKFIDLESPIDTEDQTKTLQKVKRNRNRIQFDPSISPGYASYVIPDLNFYADTGPAPVCINNRWVAYL